MFAQRNTSRIAQPNQLSPCAVHELGIVQSSSICDFMKTGIRKKRQSVTSRWRHHPTPYSGMAHALPTRSPSCRQGTANRAPLPPRFSARPGAASVLITHSLVVPFQQKLQPSQILDSIRVWRVCSVVLLTCGFSMSVTRSAASAHLPGVIPWRWAASLRLELLKFTLGRAPDSESCIS